MTATSLGEGVDCENMMRHLRELLIVTVQSAVAELTLSEVYVWCSSDIVTRTRISQSEKLLWLQMA